MRKTIEIALAEYGITERIGSTHNPRILQYFKDIGNQWIQDDETAWCSCFANWIALQSGYAYSGKLDARSWLSVGKPTYTPTKGDVVIFWRERKSSWKGHVGFYIGYSADGKQIYCLGGNQNNQVSIKAYPANRLLGFREIHHKESDLPFNPIGNAA